MDRLVSGSQQSKESLSHDQSKSIDQATPETQTFHQNIYDHLFIQIILVNQIESIS